MTSPAARALPRRRRPLAVVAASLLAVLSLVGAEHAALGATAVGHRAQSFDGWNADANGEVTGEKPEHKLWFHDGAWWASMIQSTTGAHTIHLLAGDTWVDTGTVVDGSPIAKEDTLVEGDKLYVTTRGTWKLRRFSYVDDDPGAGTGVWMLDPGFPVTLPVADAEALTLARDTAGVTWITWTQGSSLKIAHTTGSDTTWSSASTLPVAEATGLHWDDISGILAFRDDAGPAIGVMWSDQNRDVQHFAIHRDGDADDAWTVESALSGSKEADDHINLKTFEGRVYAAVKTGHNNTGQPLIRLLVRSPKGTWSAHPVATYEERDTRPIVALQIDPAERQIYVFMSRSVQGSRDAIVYKSTSINGVGFPAAATPFIDSLTTSTNNPTTMRANATAASGIVVLASDNHHYWWNRVGGTTGPPPSEATLTTSTVGQGSVVLDPPGGTYPVGTEVTLTAQAATGWTFTGWSGAVTGTTNPTSLVVQANATVTATFTENTGGGSGTISLAQSVVGTAENAASVTTAQGVTAVPGQRYLASIAMKPASGVTGVTGMGLTWTPVATQCAGRDQTAAAIWIGTGTPTTGTVSATFDGTPQSVLAVSGYTGVDPTTPVGATVTANTIGEAGPCSGGTDSNSYDLTIPTTTADGLVHGAVAMRYQSHTPVGATTEDTETHAGTGGNAAGLATTHTPATPPSTRLTGTFAGNVDWAVAQVTLREDHGGTPPPGDVVLTTSTVGQGSVVLDPPGGTYPAGTQVTLTAQPDAGWSFAGWSGDLTGTTTPTTLTLDADATVTATFTQDPPPPPGEVTLTTSTVGQGSVVLDPPGGTYPSGTQVTLTAQPDSGWTFTGWSGDLTGTTTPTTLTLDADATVVATFTEDTGGGGGDGTVALTQSVVGTAENAASVTTAQPVTADPAQRYLASIATKASREVTGVTGMGLTWTPVATQCAGRDQTAVAVWIGTGTPTSTTVTATLDGTPQAVIVVSGYTGVDPTNPIGAIGRANSTGTDTTGCAGGTDSNSYDLTLPTTSGGLVHGAVAMRFRSHTPTGTTTEDTETHAGTGGNAAGLATTHTPVTTPSTQITGVFSGNVDWAVLEITLRAGDGSEPPPPPPGDVVLTTSTVGQGSVVLDPPGGTYPSGTQVTLAAQPDSGWTFTGWSGDLTGTTTPTTLTLDADATVVATFTEDTGGGGGDGTVALTQSVVGTAENAASVTTAQPVTADPAQRYLASIATKASREVTGVTGMGLTWTPVATQCAGRDQTAVAVWIGTGTPTSTTVTATLDGTPQAVIVVSGYTGVDPTNPIGAIGRANSTGTDTTGCAGGTDSNSYDLTLPTTSGGLVHGAVAMRFRSHTPTGTTTEDTETHAGTGGNAAGLATTHTPVTTPSTQITGVFSGNVDWAVLEITLRAEPTP